MNVLLWVFQVALAFLYLGGGYFKAFKFDELATQFIEQRFPSIDAPLTMRVRSMPRRGGCPSGPAA